MQRFLIFLVVASVVNYTQLIEFPGNRWFTEEVFKSLDACIESTGIDPEIVKDAFGKARYSTSREFKCYFKCLFVNLGDMNEAGVLFPDNMKLRSPPGTTRKQADKVIDDCSTPEGSDPCEIAYYSGKCMHFAVLKLPYES